MESFTIRKIQPGDNEAIAGIIRKTLIEFGANRPNTVFDDPSTDHLFELFQAPGSVYFVGELRDEIVGGGGIFPTDGLPPATCELVKMYLLPEGRGIGLGKALILESIEFARSASYKHIYLETMPELKKAMSIYEKLGFEYLSGPMGNSGHTSCTLWMLKSI